MLDWENVAPMIVAVTLILTTGGVLLLRPLAKRAAELLEVMAKERNEPQRVIRADDGRVIELLEAMSSRMERLEERQDFTDSLLGPKREATALPPTSRSATEA